MYQVSSAFEYYIKQNTVTYSWQGTIVDKDSNTYTLTNRNIVQNSGKITRMCSSDSLSIGTTCAAELQLNLYLNVDRYKLFGATITLNFVLHMGEDTEEVPMGVFIIAECTQSNGQLSIIAYDNMTKFDDVKVSASDFQSVQLPYSWLTQACRECGVEMGSSSYDIQGLPNGNRKTGFADVVSDVQSWRDVIGYLAAYLGAFAYIGREGYLYLGKYTSNSIDTIPPSFRYSSDLSDYRTTYDGIYGVHKESGIQEYVANQNTGGLVLDLGANPFLQFTDQANRIDALGEIINLWNGVYYVPFEVEMPIVPYYDIGDVLTFTGNQASQYDYGAITEIIYTLGGKLSVRCSGDNPRLSSAQDRFSKTLAGLSSEYSNGQEIGGKNFWLLHTENTDSITVGNTRTQIAEIEWNQTTDVQKMGFMFSCDGTLSATATVDVEINVDDNEDYTFEVTEQKSLLGKRIYGANCGFTVEDKGLHTAKVYLTVTDNPLIWSDLA